MPLSVAPAGASDDPVRVLQGQSRVQRLNDDLCAIYSAAACDRPQLERTLEIFSVLAPSEQRDIVLHPLYGLWSGRLRTLGRRQRWAEAALWVRHLHRFMIVPALSSGGARGWRVRVPFEAGALRFPGVPRHVLIASDDGEVEIEVGSGTFEVRSLSAPLIIRRDELVGDGLSSAVAARPCIDGIEVDASDPWLRRFFAGLRQAEPEPGYPRRDVRPHDPVSQGEIEAVTRSLALLRATWPEMHEEVRTHVRIFVPFESTLLVGWTHASLPGAVFIRAVPDDVLFTLERLVHEASHVRLYLMSIHSLFSTDNTRLLDFPFRQRSPPRRRRLPRGFRIRTPRRIHETGPSGPRRALTWRPRPGASALVQGDGRLLATVRRPDRPRRGAAD